MLDRTPAVVEVLELSDLALDHPGDGVGKDPRNLAADVGGDARGPGEEEVADEDGHDVAPLAVGAGDAAASVRLVDDVVVVQGREVGEFDGGAGRVRPGGHGTIRRLEGRL